jgi:hypothetical protein
MESKTKGEICIVSKKWCSEPYGEAKRDFSCGNIARPLDLTTFLGHHVLRTWQNQFFFVWYLTPKVYATPSHFTQLLKDSITGIVGTIIGVVFQRLVRTSDSGYNIISIVMEVIWNMWGIDTTLQ